MNTNIRNMVQEDHPLAEASQQIKPQVALIGAYQNNGASLFEGLVHALNLSQKHIGKTGPRKADTCFATAIEQKMGSFFDPTLMQIKVAAATPESVAPKLACRGIGVRSNGFALTEGAHDQEARATINQAETGPAETADRGRFAGAGGIASCRGARCRIDAAQMEASISVRGLLSGA